MASSNLQMLWKTGNNIHSDEVYTPIEAIDPIIKYLDKDKIYFECTSWLSSSIVEYLKSKWFNILSNWDIDFLKDDLPEFDVIITNPPYSKKDKFIKRCYDIWKPFALLLPVSSIQWQTRWRMFNKHWIEILVLNKRIDFTWKHNPHFWVAWFCYNILWEKIIFSDNN